MSIYKLAIDKLSLIFHIKIRSNRNMKIYHSSFELESPIIFCFKKWDFYRSYSTDDQFAQLKAPKIIQYNSVLIWYISPQNNVDVKWPIKCYIKIENV